ncbi:MAG: M6 family metalloprotease domain-containing protein [Gemmatimonadota bacterium]|jgi:M6 family metalloprotease-like protein
MRAPSSAVVASVLAALMLGAPVAGQDVAAVSEATGIPLPAAYFETLRADSTAFTFSRALFARTGPGRVGAVGGTVRIPVVLARFSDSGDPYVTRDMVQEALFDGPSEHGTLTEAYLEMSRGALTVTGDVFEWVRTGVSLANAVGTSDGLGGDAMAGVYFAEALDSLDDTVDFAVYDNDGPDGIPDSGDDDGFVDVVTFEYLEVAASCGGPSIWPHRWRMSAWNGTAYVTDDVGVGGQPIRIEDYITQGVTDCDGRGVQNAATIAHEFGHALGLPDYYHWVDREAGPQGRRWVLGCWSLMAAGSWGCGPVEDRPPLFGPTHLTAHSKETLGWAEYVEPGEAWNEEVVLDPIETSGVALRVPLNPERDEFLIAEYRAQSGFDASLPAEGVLFYREVDRGSTVANPVSGIPYYLQLLEQDGDGALLKTSAEGGDRGEAGDAWGVGAVGKLHAETATPLLHADGSATSVTVHEVVVEDGRARIVLSTSPTPRLIVPEGSVSAGDVISYLQGVRIAGGTMPYTLTGSAPAGVEVSSSGEELVVNGTPNQEGAVDLFLWVTDVHGVVSEPLAISSDRRVAWDVGAEDLLRPFLEEAGETPSSEELLYLDDRGNRNGEYDVGDLRRWLRQPTP